MIKVNGGITAPQGFQAAGAYIGLKKQKHKKDLCLIWSDVPAHFAAVFTTNVVKAAPVIWCEQILKKQTSVRGVVVNSGNANACTGAAGMQHTEMMADTFATCMSVPKEQILVSSTGVIGVPLPIDLVKEGIKTTCKLLSKEQSAGQDAAQAIMTTDTFMKEIAFSTEIDGKTVTVGGITKGSGMIHPNMATMLAFITTDVNISPVLLKECMQKSNQQTYNMISVDGDTSTNDMAAILANGLAGNKIISEHGDSYDKFFALLNEVNLELAKAIVRDGEGATKFLEVSVHGTKTTEEAQKLAKSVISSSLVKTAFFGQDANWGRILAAMGYAGVDFNPNGVSIQFLNDAGQISLMSSGEPEIIDEAKALKILKERNIKILIEMNNGGQSSATAWGCDLSYEYVRINGSYRS